MHENDPYGLSGFLIAEFHDPDPTQSDEEIAQEVALHDPLEYVRKIIVDLGNQRDDPALEFKLVAEWANRDFENTKECKEWLTTILAELQRVLAKREDEG